ncbi:MAG: hypothetical protein KDC80_24235 [Saprospiraceae bacterium]|nr:hypothetical protein [Saprospiraceae bacterium]
MKAHSLSVWLIFTLLAFLITAMLGVGLRYAFVAGFPEWIQYRNIQHAHSHVGMMGWIYGALYTLIIYLFNLRRRIYASLFWLTQITVLGMLLSFPVQGYGAVSILFTTLHLLLSYYFTFQVFRDFRAEKQLPSHLMLKTSLILLFISTLGTWALGLIMNSPLRGSSWYFGAIQFFLHFQFNGWFIFALFGLFFRYLEGKSIVIPGGHFRRFYSYLLVSCVLTFFLAVTWLYPAPYLFLANSIGVLMQLVALYYLGRIILDMRGALMVKLERRAYGLWRITFYLFVLKIVLQSLVAVPKLAIMSYTIRNFIIGFIHLLMLGILSLFIFGLIRSMTRTISKMETIAVRIYLFAFFTTEAALFIQGLIIWMGMSFITGYYEFIFLMSVLFPVAIAIYLYDFVKNKEINFDLAEESTGREKY